MRIGRNSKKWLERIGLSCLIVVGIILGVWLFFTTNFIHPFIHYLDLRGGIIYYKEPTNIIASNVLGFDEVRGKIYYITTNGIGVYNELNNEHVFILHKEPSNEIRINDITNVYPEFSRFSDSEQEVWKSKFYADFRQRIPIEEGNIIRFPFFFSYETRGIYNLATGSKLSKIDTYKISNNIFYNVDFGSITKIDLETGIVWKYYSNNLLNYNFINEMVSSKSKEFSINELIKERNHDKQLKDKIIAIDHYSQFSKEDKEVIEELFVKLVTARDNMSLKPEHKMRLENYLE
ncbi:MAG: hypothetical protein KH759_08130 [Veillonella sp.]|uniref:hypothetical protein n=1 Tax=Veillonella TaxID=29465 RepID=UPI00257B713E|nr:MULTISPECIES: hypothetical protein [Veillonella]MBS6128594.1 hypothetical protein [Veillonella sp.]MBS7136547.1 hypothetical protein [Veillonella parvula]MDU2261875.1 hypothetical protein [Veillonella parvula]MDU3206795.1 hypothetical protein [Veillonella parvula]MDU7824533.1 hypothetical protein [Veillonella sp.]